MTASGPQTPEWLNQRFPLANTPFTLRLARADQLSSQELTASLDLLRRAFNGGPAWFSISESPLDHLLWKARDRPQGAWLQLIEEDDRLVGFSLNGFCRFRLKDAEVNARQGFDNALEPDMQGRGINSARRRSVTRDHLNSSVCLSIGLALHPTSRTRRGIATTLAFENAIDTVVKPLGIKRIISARRKQQRGTLGDSRTRPVLEAQARRLPTMLDPGRISLAARLVWSALRPSSRGARHTPWQIRTIERFDEAADAFWAEAAQAFDFIQVRDRPYLNWRYCDPRGGAFTVRVAELDGVMLGYAVLRIDSDGALLGDLLTLPDRTDVAESLLADAIHLARERGAPQLRAWMPQSHPYRTLLDDLGFVQYRTPLKLTYQVRTCDPAELEFLQDPRTSIHFMHADTDHF